MMRDPMIVVGERRGGERQRQLPLLLLGLEVQARGPVIDATRARDGAGREQQVLCEGCLAGASVARQDHVAQA